MGSKFKQIDDYLMTGKLRVILRIAEDLANAILLDIVFVRLLLPK